MAEGAAQIYQRHLDLVSDLLMSNHFDHILAVMSCPILVETIDNRIVHETKESLRTALVDFRSYLAGIDAKDYFRICKDAYFTDADQTLIEGKHQTYVLRGGNYLVEPYMTTMTLKKVNEAWLATYTRSLISNITHSILSETQIREYACQRKRWAKREITND